MPMYHRKLVNRSFATEAMVGSGIIFTHAYVPSKLVNRSFATEAMVGSGIVLTDPHLPSAETKAGDLCDPSYRGR